MLLFLLLSQLNQADIAAPRNHSAVFYNVVLYFFTLDAYSFAVLTASEIMWALMNEVVVLLLLLSRRIKHFLTTYVLALDVKRPKSRVIVFLQLAILELRAKAIWASQQKFVLLVFATGAVKDLAIFALSRVGDYLVANAARK